MDVHGERVITMSAPSSSTRRTEPAPLPAAANVRAPVKVPPSPQETVAATTPEAEAIARFSRELLEQLSAIRDESRVQFKRLAESIQEQVTESHDIIVRGLDHTTEMARGGWMDLKYITKPVDINTAGDFPDCRYVKLSDEVHLIGMIGLVVSKFYSKGKTKVTVSPNDVVRCNDGHLCDIKSRVHTMFKRGGPGKSMGVAVVTCARHHYEVENMPHVTILYRSEFRVPVEYSEYEENARSPPLNETAATMYVYILGRGVM